QARYIHANDGPDADLGHHGFGRRKYEPEAVVLRQAYEGHGLGARRSPGLDHRARVRETLGDHAGEGRRDARVGEDGLHLPLVGPRLLELLLRRGERRLGGRDLSLRNAVARKRFVDFLLRDEIRTGLAHPGEPRVRKMSRLMGRFGTLDLSLEAPDVLF